MPIMILFLISQAFAQPPADPVDLKIHWTSLSYSLRISQNRIEYQDPYRKEAIPQNPCSKPYLSFFIERYQSYRKSPLIPFPKGPNTLSFRENNQNYYLSPYSEFGQFLISIPKEMANLVETYERECKK